MKIALCLSGQPRMFKIGYKFIEKYLLNANKEHSIDIFCHAWFNEENVGKSYSSAQNYPDGHVGLVQKDTDKLIIDKFKPKKYLIEPQIDFKEYSKGFRSHPNAKQDIMCSIFYSMYRSNELKKEYEKENNFVYDLVVRTRYDLAYYNEIKLSNQPEAFERIAVLENYQNDQDVFNCINKPMPDIFSFSNSKNMDIFCSVYENMRELNAKLDVPFGERYLGHWVRNENNIELHKFKSKVVILHRVPNIRKYL